MINLGIYLLLALNILIPLFVVYKSCVAKEGVEINHIMTYTIGYLFYWVAPMMIGVTRIFESLDGGPLWYGLFDSIPDSTIFSYMFMSLCCYLAFTFGTVMGRRPSAQATPVYRGIKFDIRVLNLFLVFGAVVAGMLIFMLRGELFKGYKGSLDETYGPRGTFTASSQFLLALALVACMKRMENWRRMNRQEMAQNFWRVVYNRYSAVYLFVAIMVVSTGMRLYFISGLLILFIYKSIYFQRLRARHLLIGGASLVALATGAGILRMGDQLNLGSLLINLFSEPFYNSLSLLNFLHEGHLEMLKAPIFLGSSFINLIPMALLPGKEGMMINPNDYGYTIFSPGGSLSSFFSFMINFGFLGTLVALFALSYGLSYLRRRDYWLASRVTYIMIAGYLPTTFFRDPFSNSIVKSFFEFSLLMPILLIVLANLITQGMQKMLSENRKLPQAPLRREHTALPNSD